MIKLFCPNCRSELHETAVNKFCQGCNFSFIEKNGILISSDINQKDKEYYDEIYNDEHGQKWFKGLDRTFLKKVLESMSLSYRRERFFKKNLVGKTNMILDIACGAGRDYFKEYGTVVGIDLALKPLEVAKDRYDTVIQAGVDKLPFADNTFDYVISSDFFGHILPESKDAIIKEMLRVLKPGGKTLHVIENDSANYLFKFAHLYPDLFKKYFIDAIGGHIGLELPSVCVERWKKDGFCVEKAEKIWGTIWPISYYRDLFGKEYYGKSRYMDLVLAVSKVLSASKLIEVATNIVLNPVSFLIEKITPLDHGVGLMLVCKKK